MRKIVFILLTIFILSSCKKEAPIPPETPTNCKFEGIGTLLNKKINRFQFNTDSTIKKIIHFDTLNNIENYYTIFSYTKDSVLKNKYSNDGILVNSQKYTLNEKHYAVLKTEINDSTIYKYDSNGYLIQTISKTSFGSDTLYFKNEEGKRTLITSNSKPHSIDTISYEYYNFAIPQPLGSLLENRYETVGDPIKNEIFLGKNTNLALKKRTIRYTDSSHYIIEFNYFYEFDTNNNLTKIKGIVGYKGLYTLHTFEIKINYVCN